MDNIQNREVPRAIEEAADPAPHAAVVVDGVAGSRVEALAVLHSALVDGVAEREYGRERVRELYGAEGREDGDEAEEVGDCGGHDVGDRPVDGHDGGPEVLALLGGERGRGEEVHEDVVVEYFDADVAIERGGDDAAEHGEHIADALPAIGGDAEVGERVDVLPLVTVAEETVEHVHEVDEGLGGPHGLDEIARPPHLRHELDEELRASVRSDTLHEAVDGANEVGWVRETSIVFDWWVYAVDWCHIVRDCGRSSRAKSCDPVVWRAVRDGAHGDGHERQIGPDSGVGKPSKLLQGANLADSEAANGPTQTADGIAELELGNLGNGLSITDDDQSNGAEELEELQYINAMAGDSAVESECKVAIVSGRKLIRIKT